MCLQTFQLNINQSKVFSGASVKTWVSGAQRFWALYDTNTSTFEITGFKNINLYSVELVGFVQTDVLNLGATSCIVNDYGFLLNLNGQFPNVSGQSIGTNFFGISQNNKDVSITKYRPKLEFCSPIQSLKQIQIVSFFGQGNDAETNNIVALNYNLTLLFNYAYEGE